MESGAAGLSLIQPHDVAASQADGRCPGTSARDQKTIIGLRMFRKPHYSSHPIIVIQVVNGMFHEKYYNLGS